MSITSVFDKLKPGFDALLKDKGAEPLVLHELGSDHLSAAGSAPAIVWEPLGAASIQAISGPSAPVAKRLRRPVAAGGPATLALGEARDTGRIQDAAQYATRFERIRWHIWAKPRFSDLEALVNRYVAFVRVSTSGHAFKPMTTDWSLGQDQQSKAYHVCLMEVVIKVPFTFEPMGTAAYPLTVTVEGEILEPGESLS